MTETSDRSPGITADSAGDGEPANRRDPLTPTVLQLVARSVGPIYQCPGETLPISQAVHLSRMATHYAKCRQCPHADDRRSLAPSNLEPSAARETAGGGDLFRRDGLEGRYLAALDRTRAEALSTAIAAAFWECVPRRCRSEDESPTTTPTVPELVIGRDTSAVSRDLMCGVVRGLLRMGCHVIDVGAISRPVLDFAVYHLRAAGGVFVSGTGTSAGAVGMQVVDHQGLPWSSPGRLDRLRELSSGTVVRWTRRGGNMQSYDVTEPARAEFQRHFHSVPPVRLGAMIDCPLQRAQASAWSTTGPLDVVPLVLDLRALTSEERGPAARRELRTLCRADGLSGVMHLARDGQQVTLFDERGQRIDPAVWLVRLVEQEAAGRGGGVVVGADVSPLPRGRLKALGRPVHTAQADQESIVSTLIETQSLLAADGCGRVWFGDHYPVCDGLVTAARLARLAGQAAQPLSHWAA